MFAPGIVIGFDRETLGSPKLSSRDTVMDGAFEGALGRRLSGESFVDVASAASRRIKAVRKDRWERRFGL